MRTSILTENPVPVPNYDLVFIVDRIGRKWRFNGYSCRRCGRLIKNDSTIEQHTKNCLKGGYKLKKDPELQISPKILTVDRTDWKPYTDK